MLDDLAATVRRAIAETGPGAFGMYKGTAHYLESAAAGMAPALLHALGSESWYTSLTVDCPAVTLVAEQVVGHPWLLPVPDLAASLVVLVGTNPVASHGHTFNVAAPTRWLRRWARTGELWVIDPQRTATARHAGVHLQPRPGTDHVLFAHLVRELLEDGADVAWLARHADGVQTLRDVVAPFDERRVVQETGLDADAVAHLLDAIRRHGRVAMVTGTGVNFQPAANLSVWLAWMVSAVTGSLDRPRGLWFNPGYLSQNHRAGVDVRDGAAAPGPRSRPELPGRFGELPCAAVVDEIEAGNLRTLVVLGGNPLIAWPQPKRTAAALRRLDALAVVDVIDHDLTRLATHVLPAAGQLERADVPTGAEVYALSSFSQLTDAVLPRGAERRPTWWILAQLGRRLGVDLLPSGLDPDTAGDVDVLAALYGSDRRRWDALVEAPSGVEVHERPYGWVRRRMPEGRVRLAPRPLVDQLRATPATTRPALVAIPRRELRKINSTLADGVGLRRPASAAALVHPTDAARLGIADGDRIVIASAHGRLATVAQLSEAVLPGCVSAPHGFVGANAAALTSTVAGAVDPQTGMPFTTAIPVDVTLDRSSQ